MAIEKIINFTLEVLPPADLFCEVVPLAQAVRIGRVAHYTVNLRSLEDFAGTVDITVEGLPVALSFSTTLTAGGEAAVPVDIDTTALSARAYSLTLRVVGTEA
jgi:hypothetical protein